MKTLICRCGLEFLDKDCFVAHYQQCNFPYFKWNHKGDCAKDEFAKDVCEGMYLEKCDDNHSLCEALRAVYALAGENSEIERIVNDAIKQYGGVGET